MDDVQDIQDMIRFSCYFRRSATEKELEEFWEEYVDQGIVILDEITEAEIVDTETGEHIDDVWVTRLRTNEHNYYYLESEFAPYLAIKRD